MNFMMIGSINTYTTTMKMQMKWQQKQATGNYAADGSTSVKTSKSKPTNTIEIDGIELELPRQDSATQMRQQIETKLKSGKRLSADEMDFLRENAPELYQKAKKIEMERQAYERELKQCKTKEEAQRVKFSHTTASLASVKSIASNSSIPKEKKLELITEELMKTSALEDSFRKYARSGSYKKLPTEAEKKKAEEDLAEAKRAELDIDDKSEEDPKDLAEDEKTVSAENKTSDLETAKKTVSDHETTRMEAEVTPEARKVRYAKAQAAYAQAQPVGNYRSAFDIKIK